MQSALVRERGLSKLYVSVERTCGISSFRIVLKDSYGTLVEERRETFEKYGGDASEYSAVVRALEMSARYCREKVYVFTSNRRILNHLNRGRTIKNKKISRLVVEIRFLQGFFKCVRFFQVPRN